VPSSRDTKKKSAVNHRTIRAPYHPRMMTKILIYGYCVGVFSSRRIQQKLSEDIGFRVLAAGMTMLTAMTFPHFRVAASFSGSPDAVGYTRHAVAIGADVPFNYRDPWNSKLRSARVYAASFKCPVRIYYGADETHFALSSQPTAKLAREHGLDVQAIAVDGGHNSAVGAEMRMAIVFFRQARKGGE
jgi:hypothetical protein